MKLVLPLTPGAPAGAAASAPQSWQAMLDALPDAAWIVELPTRRVLLINAAACRLLGTPRDELLGAPADAMIPNPEDLAYWAEVAQGTLSSLSSETHVYTSQRRAVPVLRSISPLLLDCRPAATAGHCLISLRDRSAQRRAEEDREAVVSELQATLEATADGILVTDRAGHIRSFNKRFAEIWDLPLALLEAKDDAAVADWMCRSVVGPEAYQQRLKTLQEAALLNSTERLTLHTGQVLERVTRPLWTRSRPQGRVYSFRDLTDSLAADQRMASLAGTDALTGLPNRRRLSDSVAAVAARSRRSGAGFALLLVDLDRFRHINDSLGHDTGDRVLVDVARRIQGCMRPDDQLARIGGDQFAMLVENADGALAETTARRVLAVVGQPCTLDGVQFTLTCSIGVVLSPANGNSLDHLITNAEAAMRQAKDDGRASYRLHQPRAQVDFRRHMLLDHAMRQALVSGRFRLHYQPQIDLASGELMGAEALIRWRDPELGEITPAQFIPVAEDSGFIVAIGDWVLSQAVRQAALWHERGMAVPIAINVSALQFQQNHFVDRVASVLAVSGLPPQMLELELTESILVRDAQEALHRLQALSRLGVRLSIDDFGTGYSSLAYLKRFPIDKLKIDRSFIKGLPADESDVGIVRAILQMARALGMKVVAEGVETEVQRQFLLDEGCEQFQGFLFAPALDSLSFERRVLSERHEAAARAAGGAPHMRLVHG